MKETPALPSQLARLQEREFLLQADPFGMMERTLDLPTQCEEGIRRAASWDELPHLAVHPRQILVTGMGGSAIGGDYLRCLFEAQGRIPVSVNRDYTLPAFVNAETLVFVVSYSGNTEETLAAYEQARASGASILTLSSGGELQARARRDGVPHLLMPGGQPPRTALGYLFFPLVVLCERLALLPDLTKERERTIQRLRQARAAWAPDVAYDQNLAKQLAAALYGRIPILYGTSSSTAAVALRWKGQVNENAKMHAFAAAFPELNHNEILGWKLAKQQASNFAVVVLRDPNETPQMKKRITATKNLIGEATRWHEVYAEGDSLLERLLHLTYLGDFVSLYLAFLNGVDPHLIDYIEQLKAQLKSKTGDPFQGD